MPHRSPSLAHHRTILEHYRTPRNRGELEVFHGKGKAVNCACGDEIRVTIRLEEDKIGRLMYSGEGCSVSQAAASIMTEIVKGKTVSAVRLLAARYHKMLLGHSENGPDEALGDLAAFQTISQYPPRVPCAFLGFEALFDALKNHPFPH